MKISSECEHRKSLPSWGLPFNGTKDNDEQWIKCMSAKKEINKSA